MVRAVPDPEEEEALACLDRYMEIVWRKWGLACNKDEQVSAIHVLQHGVIQHMLHRVEPEVWGNWFTSLGEL